MASAVDKYKSKLADLSKPRRGGGGQDYIDLVGGKNIVRLLPGHPNMDGFYSEVFYHKKNVGGKTISVQCPNAGDEDGGNCPICEQLESMRRSKDKKQKDLYYSWRAKPRFFANAVDRADETPTIKVLAFGSTILKQILEIAVDPDEFGDIFDPKEGCDIIIKKSGQKLDTEYVVTPRRQPTPLCETNKEIRALIGKSEEDTLLKDLTEIGSSTLSEKEMLALWAGQQLDEDDDEEEEVKPKAKKKKVEDDDEEEEEKPKAKVKSKKPVVEDEDDDEEEVKPKPKAKKKPVVEDDDEEEEEEVKPKPKAKKKPVDEDDDEEEEKPKAKAKAKKPADDEDDDDEEDLEAVLAKHKKGVKK